MLDDMYTRLTNLANYKLLMFLPLLLTVAMVSIVYTNGVPLGIDFKGGTWIEVIPESSLSDDEIIELTSQLKSINLEDLEVYVGGDVITGRDKLTVITTSQVDQEGLKSILSNYAGSLYETDSASVKVQGNLTEDVQEKIAARFKADVAFNESTGVMWIDAFDLDEAKLESALEFYLGNFTLDVQKKNVNIKPVGETLGKTFREQGIKAAIFAYVLVILIIFFAFRDLIPSIAVILAGTCDALIALGGMSLFGIVFEPASLAALIMLIGYSVDSDIMLTSRVLRTRTGTVDERINDAMKTGLTMSGTTIAVMLVIIVVSTTLFQIETLKNIASVLLIGLLGDTTTTWLMNAGILKWYVEEKGGKLDLRKSLRGL
ncbi:MAG: protein translocase subunit SecF [Candidatus Altiarchaeota archaeon]|nr:protein translocase subunit SecF [Candidatus Altiarchaeota archaeon]